MSISEIKQIIKCNEYCYFTYFKNNNLYYSFFYNAKEVLFPILVTDLNGVQMNFQEKSISLMGYIRKAVKLNNLQYKEIE